MPLVLPRGGRIEIAQLDHALRPRDWPGRQDGGHLVLARIAHLPTGPLDVDSLVGDPSRWLGLLVTEGALLAEVRAARARVGWITGPDDLITPWELPESPLTGDAEWRVLVPTRVALLDSAFSRQAECVPGMTQTLLERQARTVRWLLAKSLVLSAPLIEERLLLLFALLAERHGRVTPEGVRLDLPVTHELLASLCGARRPSVTMALRSLCRQRLIERTPDGRWLLRRDLETGEAVRPSCWDRYAAALGLDG